MPPFRRLVSRRALASALVIGLTLSLPASARALAPAPAPAEATATRQTGAGLGKATHSLRALTLTIPSGKGMWIWLPDQAEGGDPAAIVTRARHVGLTHIYVRTGSSKQGFHGREFLDQILPAAHVAGLRVYGWDFPYLFDPAVDVARAVEAIRYRTPDGHGIDGFVADIETASEGTNLTVEGASAYGQGLRKAVGRSYPLVIAVPRPSAYMIPRYPWNEAIAPFSAIAPMVYWLNRQPDSDVAGAMRWLSQFGKPIIPIGQAYDGGPEGGRPGVPPPDELHRFMQAAEAGGADGVSFWSWQHANQPAWDALRDAPQFADG